MHTQTLQDKHAGSAYQELGIGERASARGDARYNKIMAVNPNA
jgi:hypothetical protein